MLMSCLKLCFVSERGAVNDVSKQPQLPGNPGWFNWILIQKSIWQQYVMLGWFMGGVDLTGIYRRCSFKVNIIFFVAVFPLHQERVDRWTQCGPWHQLYQGPHPMSPLDPVFKTRPCHTEALEACMVVVWEDMVDITVCTAPTGAVCTVVACTVADMEVTTWIALETTTQQTALPRWPRRTLAKPSSPLRALFKPLVLWPWCWSLRIQQCITLSGQL